MSDSADVSADRLAAAEGLLSIVNAARARVGAMALRHLTPAQHLALAKEAGLGHFGQEIRLMQKLVDHRLPEAIRGDASTSEPTA